MHCANSVRKEPRNSSVKVSGGLNDVDESFSRTVCRCNPSDTTCVRWCGIVRVDHIERRFKRYADGVALQFGHVQVR